MLRHCSSFLNMFGINQEKQRFLRAMIIFQDVFFIYMMISNRGTSTLGLICTKVSFCFLLIHF